LTRLGITADSGLELASRRFTVHGAAGGSEPENPAVPQHGSAEIRAVRGAPRDRVRFCHGPFVQASVRPRRTFRRSGN